MPTALKLTIHCHVIKFFFFSVCLVAILLGPSANFAQARQANVSISNIGYLANEPTALDLTRDLKVEGRIVECKNLNESASWFEVCNQLSTSTNPILLFDGSRLRSHLSNLTKPDSKQYLPPLVEVTTQDNQTRYFRFIQMNKQSFSVKSANQKTPIQNVTARLSFDAVKRETSCELSVPEIEDEAIRKEWVLKRFTQNGVLAENQLVIDNNKLSFEYFKGFDLVSCQYVLFDGLLFKRIQISQPIRTIELIPNRASNPIRVQSLEDFYLVSLEHAMGPRETDRLYTCKQISSDPMLPNLCDAFNLTTGHMILDEKTTKLLNSVLRDGPTVYSLKIGKQKAGTGAWGTEVPIEIEVIPSQAAVDLFKKDRETPVLKIEHGPQGQRFFCDTSALPPEKRSALISWKINNQLFQGWSASVLNTLLVAFGNTYACGVDGQWSANVTFDSTYLSLSGPDRVAFLSTDVRALIAVEPSLFLGDVKRSWTCETSDKNLVCAFLDSDRNSRRLIEVRRLSKQTPVYASTIKIKLTIDEASLENKVLTKDVILQSETDKTYVDVSSHIRLRQGAGGLVCHIDRPTDEFNETNTTFSWIVGDRPHAQTDKNFLPFERQMVGQIVSCIAKLRKGNFFGIGSATIRVESPAPLFENIPELIALDLQYENNIHLDISDRYNSLRKVQCDLIYKDLLVLPDICSIGKIDSKPKNIHVHISAVDIQRVLHIAQKLNRVDPYFLTGFELNIELTTSERVLTKRINTRLFKPNMKPKILSSSHYIDEEGMQICQFAVADANNDHLNVKLFFNSDPTHAVAFSTFERGGAETLKVESAEANKQIIRIGVAKNKRPPKARPGCSFMISDGTLVSTSNSSLRQNAFDAKIELDQAIAKAKLDTAKPAIGALAKEEIILPKFEPRLTTAGSVAVPSELKIQDVYAFDAKHPIVLELDEKFKNKNSLSFTCLGHKRICSHISFNNRHIVIDPNNLRATEDVVLSIHNGKQNHFFYSLVIHKKMEDLLATNTCFSAENQEGNPLGVPVSFANKPLFVPQSLLTNALAVGFQMKGCKPFSETKNYSLSSNIYRPKTQVISILDALFKSAPATDWELMISGQFKLSDCRISNGTIDQACKYNPENLLVLLPTDHGNLSISATVNYVAGGIPRIAQLVIKVFDVYSKNETTKPSLKATADTARSQIHCVATGIDDGLNQFDLYEGLSLIGQLETHEHLATFNIHLPQLSSVYICQLKKNDLLVSASTLFSKQSELLETTCFSSKLEAIKCLPNIYSSKIEERRFEEISQFLEKDYVASGEFIKIRTRSPNSHLVSSETIQLPSNKTKPHAESAAFIETTRLYLSNNFLNQPICFNSYVFHSNLNKDEELKKKNNDISCLQASLAGNFASQSPSISQVTAPFFPESDVIFGQMSEPPILKKWAQFFDFQNLKKSKIRLRKIVCKSNEVNKVTNCVPFAGALKLEIKSAQNVIIEQESNGFLRKQAAYNSALSLVVYDEATASERELDAVYFY